MRGARRQPEEPSAQNSPQAPPEHRDRKGRTDLTSITSRARRIGSLAAQDPRRALRSSFALGLVLTLAVGGCGEPAPEHGIPVLPPDAPADPECPADATCEWVPAAFKVRDPMTGAYGNYDLADRPRDGLQVRYIVIHTTEVDWDGTIKIFQDPARSASAHYLVRSSDGRIAQFVPTRHVAWHAGNWYYNMHSVGIEHEAWSAQDGKWFTEAMYRESARLTRHLAAKYGVPLDRSHIIGHDEVPGINQARQKAMHWDPGPYWDWERYMKLVLAPDDSEEDKGAVDTAIEIRPPFAQNQPTLSYCYGPSEASDCREAPKQPANFLYLRQAPDPMAPLIENSYLSAWPGDRMYNWGNKARSGRVFVRAERMGEWDAIFFSGQKAWLHNPGQGLTRRVSRMMVTPKTGMMSIPVFGVGYPADSAYMPPTKPQVVEKIYDLPAGQRYAVVGQVAGDYYWAKTYFPSYSESDYVVVKDGTEYVQISFNHRGALVRKSDVDVLMMP